MSRRAAREAAMKLLYQKSFLDTLEQDSVDEMISEHSLNKNDATYLMDIIDGYTANNEMIDEIIKKHAKGWKFDRISKVDLSIFRVALYEINFMEDIPIDVSINEAVELAKKYGSEKSGSFINGLLGTYVRAEKSNPDLNN